MTRIKATVRMYSSSNCTRIYLLTAQVMPEDSVMVKMTAMPMPTAVSVRLDTPRKGQQPMVRTKT